MKKPAMETWNVRNEVDLTFFYVFRKTDPQTIKKILHNDLNSKKKGDKYYAEIKSRIFKGGYIFLRAVTSNSRM